MGLLKNVQIIKRVIDIYGKIYNCEHQEKDSYGEPTGDKIFYTIFGLFHDKGKPVFNLVMSDGGTIQTKPHSHLLTMDEEITDSLKGDKVTVNNKIYEIIAISNYMEENLVYDISLDVVI